MADVAVAAAAERAGCLARPTPGPFVPVIRAADPAVRRILVSRSSA
jgi:hypothetical protein